MIGYEDFLLTNSCAGIYHSWWGDARKYTYNRLNIL